MSEPRYRCAGPGLIVPCPEYRRSTLLSDDSSASSVPSPARPSRTIDAPCASAAPSNVKMLRPAPRVIRRLSMLEKITEWALSEVRTAPLKPDPDDAIPDGNEAPLAPGKGSNATRRIIDD